MCNTIFSLLPNSLNGKQWIKLLRIITAFVILIYGISQIITRYKNSSSAYISSNGEVIKSHNFPWKINKDTDPNGNFSVYLIESRYGDPSEFKVVPDRHVRNEIFLSLDGIGIKFFCKSDEVPNFTVTIRP